MSLITLEFSEYQEIRDAMAYARGQLISFGAPDPYPGWVSLDEANQVLENARWRTEEQSSSKLKDIEDQATARATGHGLDHVRINGRGELTGIDLPVDPHCVPVKIEANEEWMDWMPGLGYSGRAGESPAECRRRQATWSAPRRFAARCLGWLV